ncbi:MAG TPA: chloride channel protein [Edaphocola sp.]|nr:chloride channel protein [Edaphocola sp.]
MDRTKIQKQNSYKLILVSLVISAVASFLAYTLKIITEFFEEHIFEFAKSMDLLPLFILPSIGITAIYFLRKYLFLNRKNKGIAEIYKTVDKRKDHLPFFKIPSHYLNGFLTVIFGGSTGIEVSTVVATATIGNAFYDKHYAAKMYKLELICAGVCAGIAILFNSPIAGWLFAIEVIARKLNRSLFISCTASAIGAWIILSIFPTGHIISTPVKDWSWMAIPFMLILSIFSGLLSAYFTLLVVNIKKLFNKISNNFIRVNSGALVVGSLLFIFPFLYGDSYHSLNELFQNPIELSILSLVFLAVLKPIASALTLGAGGDGGVFAPSIVAGAYLGLAFSILCNKYLGTTLIPVNFALIGAAATLSTSIYAPLTTLFLICNLVPNGFQLAIPILAVSYIAKIFTQKFILPYNVYTYFLEKSK